MMVNSDTFCEQIVKIKSTGKSVALKALIWIGALAVSTALIMLMKYVGALIVILEFLLFYGAVKLTEILNIEYEYIITNGDLDIDKIISRSTRKRILTLNCSTVEKIGKYKPGMQLHGKIFVCCNASDESYYLLSRHKNLGAVCLVIAPDERLKKAIKECVPRIIQKDAFSD